MQNSLSFTEKFALVLSTLRFSFLNLSLSLLSHGFLCQYDICQPPHARPSARALSTNSPGSISRTVLTFSNYWNISLENTVLCVNQSNRLCLFHNSSDIWTCIGLVSWETRVILTCSDPNYVQTAIYIYIYIYLSYALL